jgi:hypothetical protein
MHSAIFGLWPALLHFINDAGGVDCEPAVSSAGMSSAAMSQHAAWSQQRSRRCAMVK